MELVNKPWGQYEVVRCGPTYKVKILTIAPWKRISMQRHFTREEHWHVLSGVGKAFTDGREQDLIPGTAVHVHPEDMHRIEAGEEELVILEVQRGQCNEEDIERLEDDFGRVGTTGT